MLTKLIKPLRASQRVSLFASAVLVALLMFCASIAYAQLMTRLLRGWNNSYIPWACLIISIEAFYSYTFHSNRPFGSRVLLHLSELVVILLGLKALILLMNGTSNLMAEIALWQESLVYFFFGEYLFALMPVIVTWAVSFVLASNIAQMQIQEDEIYMDNAGMLELDRHNIRQSISEWVMGLGIVMVLMAFLTRLDLVQVFGENAPVRAPVTNVVAYFLLAFILLSQMQFSLLRGHWLWSRAPVSSKMPATWLKYSLLFFAVVAGIALLLPTRYSLGLLQTLQMAISFLGQLIMLLFFLITYPFTWLLQLISRLFRSSEVEEMPETSFFPPRITSPETGGPIPWLEVLKSLLFWAIFLGVAGYFITYYLRQNRHLLAPFRQVPFFRWLGSGWRKLMEWLHGVNRQVGAAIQVGRERLFRRRGIPMPVGLRSFINFRSYNARQRVLFFYLRLVERSGQEGIPRAPSQTPYQYSQRLHDSLPEVEGEVEGMTEAFIEARYSRHAISDEQAGFVQRLWKKIIQALHGVQKT